MFRSGLGAPSELPITSKPRRRAPDGCPARVQSALLSSFPEKSERSQAKGGWLSVTLLPEGEMRPGRLRPFVRRELVSPSPVVPSGDPTR